MPRTRCTMQTNVRRNSRVFQAGRDAFLEGQPREYTKLPEAGRFVGCPYNPEPVMWLQPTWLAGYDQARREAAS